MVRQNIAVVGGGIAGLAAAWLLRDEHQVTLFEKNDHAGGHAHTLDVPSEQGLLPVDTGFVVFNERNYPHLTGLLRHLGVVYRGTDMSFSASIDGGRLEYGGSTVDTLFAQRKNLLNPTYLRMLGDILHFNRAAKRLLADRSQEFLSLGAFLDRHAYSTAFRNHYLLPMAAAIWSCPVFRMLEFPALSLIRFFDNHGLLDLSGRPQWQTIKGGSRSCVERILADLGGRVSVGDPVARRRGRIEFLNRYEFVEQAMAQVEPQSLALATIGRGDEPLAGGIDLAQLGMAVGE